MSIAGKLLLVGLEALAENNTADALDVLKTLASRPDYLTEIRSVFASSCEGLGNVRGLHAVASSLNAEDDEQLDGVDEWDEVLLGEPLLGATLSAADTLSSDTQSPITLA